MTTTATYRFIPNLNDLIPVITPETIVSRTISDTAGVRVTLFGFAEGQALTEHSAAQSAIIYIVQGEATLTLGGETYEVSAGAWAEMPPRLSHSVYAKTPLYMLLFMSK